ncbi:hypothetical protein N7494_012010 [Penicillium frequentans]|uniref:Uncharacterized protein n=1 Tax=Penicillium frequentans TaxID=3151616 RepID=A0AAD6CMI8_9EURO|nr:hypothetical protein N7494_012010 [Penicillium glabrum]
MSYIHRNKILKKKNVSVSAERNDGNQGQGKWWSIEPSKREQGPTNNTWAETKAQIMRQACHV